MGTITATNLGKFYRPTEVELLIGNPAAAIHPS